IGRMLVYDGLDLSFDTVSLAKNPACPCCSKPANDIVLRAEQMVCSAPRLGGSITAEALQARLDAGEDLVLLDVRNPPEWAGGVIPGARLLPKPEIEAALRDLPQGATPSPASPLSAIPKGREVVVYCQGGLRSAAVIRALAAAGYSADQLVNMEGGFTVWRGAVATPAMGPVLAEVSG
ncbi:MAG TPA: rhodanese-like domain-containing protein, partial [Roseomonas sp.]|nr:rhodanese-like domain-containing protein [Roseomonas sp.]